jgi:hypothetical protein
MLYLEIVADNRRSTAQLSNCADFQKNRRIHGIIQVGMCP